jgi:hypothetical protein
MHMDSGKKKTLIHLPLYLITMVYAINAKVMGTKHIFVEMTLWKILDKARMWIPLSNKLNNS